MPLYAGTRETNVTPPPGVWMSGYGGRPTGAVGVHDELFARALALDNGRQRAILLSMDLIALDDDLVRSAREGIAAQAGLPQEAVMLHCTHTHGGPAVRSYRAMGPRDEAYVGILVRKLIGVAKQAAENLEPAQLTYGEASAQIGVNRRQTLTDGRTILGADYAAPVSPLVQTLCVNGADGRTFAMLFCHACHPTTLGGENLYLTAEWPGAAVARLKERFRKEGEETGIAGGALPFFLQGCCGDINPNRRGTWEAVAYNGRQVADAAHTARWNAHGHLGETIEAAEATVELPMLPPPSEAECERQIEEWQRTIEHDRAYGASEGRLLFDQGRLEWAQAARVYAAMPVFRETQPFTIQRLNLGGLHILGFPAEMFVQYQLDFSSQSEAPVLTLGYTNGCSNYMPTAAEYARGGYEVDDAHRYYGTLMYGPGSEAILRDAAYRLLGIADPVKAPYPLRGRSQ